MGVGLGAMDTIVSCKQRNARKSPASFGSFNSRATAKRNVRPMDSGHSIWTCSHGSTHECAQSLSLHLSCIALSLSISPAPLSSSYLIRFESFFKEHLFWPTVGQQLTSDWPVIG
jgi:hypothetical protein